MTTTFPLTEDPTTSLAPDYPLIDSEWGEDPLEGVPQALLQRRGAMDVDTAGGCG